MNRNVVHKGNGSDKGKSELLGEEPVPSATLSITVLTISLGRNTTFHCKSPTTNRLSQGMIFKDKN